MFKHAVIIAGGYGSRMRPLTDYVPKPLVKVNDVPLIQYVINFLRDNNVDNITVSYGYKGEMVLEEVKHKVESFINTTGKDNSYFLFNSIVKYIDEPIIICPCDMIVRLDLEEVYKEYVKLDQPIACIIPVKTELDADCVISGNNKVLGITREVQLGTYASGIQILNPYRINKLIPPFENFYDVWKALIEKELLYVTDIMPTEWKIFDRLTDLP
jgi:MurNAc alpha-1-phosphate uridylyltransferase